MERVDIVNEQDEFLYSVSKEESHQKGLLHRTVIAMIRDSKDRWVLVKQADDRQDPGQYVSPIGGHVQSGENCEDALSREADEETGVNLSECKYEFVGKAIYDRQFSNKRENHYFIYYNIYTDQDLILNHESVSFERFTTEDLKLKLKENSSMFGEAFHFVIDQFFPQLR